MTVTRRQALAAGAAALPLTATVAVAQQPAAGQSMQQVGEDPFLAACMLLGGKRQIEVCRFALDRIQDADVKAFAQAEITEHETLKADLAKLGYTPPAAAAAGAATGVRQSGAAVDGTGAAQGRMGGASVSVGKATFGPELSRAVLIDAEVHETCIANTRQMLTKCEQKGKTKLDKGFVGDQLHTHMGLKDKVTTFQKHASQEMQPGLAKALAIIEQHIATCERLMEKLEAQAMKEMSGTRRNG